MDWILPGFGDFAADYLSGTLDRETMFGFIEKTGYI
jgi:hypothetical protein